MYFKGSGFRVKHGMTVINNCETCINDMNEFKSNKRINIKGLACTYTFVKAKLAVEDMEIGEVIEILLDYEEAARSTPKFMEELEQSILSAQKINDIDWKLLIRKEKGL